MGDEADRIEAVSAGKPFKPADVELGFSVIRAGIIFFATLEFVDNAINLVELSALVSMNSCFRLCNASWMSILDIFEVYRAIND